MIIAPNTSDILCFCHNIFLDLTLHDLLFSVLDCQSFEMVQL